MARTSKQSESERILQKRLAARIRQRRCRERKKNMALETKNAHFNKLQEKALEIIHSSHDNKQDAKPKRPHAAPSSRAAVPSSPTISKVHAVHYPAPTNNFRPPLYAHPVYIPHHAMHMAMRPMGSAQTFMRPHFHQGCQPPMMSRVPGPKPMIPFSNPVSVQSAAPQPAICTPRVISRSSSSSSVDFVKGIQVDHCRSHVERDVESAVMENPPTKTSLASDAVRKLKQILATEEKAAVAAILSLKETSDDSSAEESLSGDDSTSLIIDDSSRVVPANLNRAFSNAHVGQSNIIRLQTIAA